MGNLNSKDISWKYHKASVELQNSFWKLLVCKDLFQMWWDEYKCLHFLFSKEDNPLHQQDLIFHEYTGTAMTSYFLFLFLVIEWLHVCV